MGQIKNYEANRESDDNLEQIVKNATTKEETYGEKMARQARENSKNELTLIPKSEIYIQYMLDVIFKMPKTEKYSIGTEYKKSMYQMLENIMYLSKIDISERLQIVNKIDAQLNAQRIFLRIMTKNRWIDEHKCKVAMDYIYEIGKIIGGLVKYYGKNNKK